MSAPDASTLETLSASMASEMWGNFTAKVPPKPQQVSAWGSSRNSRPSTRPNSSSGLLPDLGFPQHMATGVIGHRALVLGARVRHSEHLDQEFRELVDPARQVPRLPGQCQGRGETGHGRRPASSRCMTLRAQRRSRRLERPGENPLSQLAGLAGKARVVQGLAAAGLLHGEVYVHAKTAQSVDDADPHLGVKLVYDAGCERGRLWSCLRASDGREDLECEARLSTARVRVSRPVGWWQPKDCLQQEVTRSP